MNIIACTLLQHKTFCFIVSNNIKKQEEDDRSPILFRCLTSHRDYFSCCYQLGSFIAHYSPHLFLKSSFIVVGLVFLSEPDVGFSATVEDYYTEVLELPTINENIHIFEAHPMYLPLYKKKKAVAAIKKENPVLRTNKKKRQCS